MDGLQLQHPSLADWDRITGNHEVNMAKSVARESASRILHVFEARQHVLKKLDPSNHKWKETLHSKVNGNIRGERAVVKQTRISKGSYQIEIEYQIE